MEAYKVLNKNQLKKSKKYSNSNNSKFKKI